jgi:hypothetical protein
MKKTLILTIIMGVMPSAAFSLESPANSNPLGLGTVPPTAYKSGLIPSINPIDTSGNNVITGNVSGGMQFRGVVPYTSITDFSMPVTSLSHTSGSLDSFLRDSQGSQATQQPGHGLTPFYSPSFTETRIIPGTGGMVTTPSGGVSPLTPYAGSNVPQTNYQVGLLPITRRPLSMNMTDMEQSLESDATRFGPGVTPVAEAQSQEQFWRDMGVRLTRKAEQIQPEGINPQRGIDPNTGLYRGYVGINPLNPTAHDVNFQPKLITVKGEEGAGTQDVYEQMKMQLGKASKTREEMRPKAEEKPAPNAIQPTEPNTAEAVQKSLINNAQADVILGSYKSFAAYSTDRFNRHMRAAESYLKQGRYYRAADAYTLATVYKPDDPLAYAGKSISLFASGEYMSSALFLARAVEIFPDYPKVKVDLVVMIGDKDTVENRIIEAREWSRKSDSGEMDFLLSYIFYQMDRMEFARQAIESAAAKMPDSKPVMAMKKAIDERLGK